MYEPRIEAYTPSIERDVTMGMEIRITIPHGLVDHPIARSLLIAARHYTERFPDAEVIRNTIGVGFKPVAVPWYDEKAGVE